MMPLTYSQWCSLFDRFCNGEEDALAEMEQCSFIVDAGTASRFCKKAEQVYRTRKKNWLDTFQRRANTGQIKTIDDFGLVLRNAKQNLQPISRFSRITAFPVALKETLARDLDEFVSEIRKSLTDSAKGKHGGEQMTLLISSFKLDEETETANRPIMTTKAEENIGRKKILF